MILYKSQPDLPSGFRASQSEDRTVQLLEIYELPRFTWWYRTNFEENIKFQSRLVAARIPADKHRLCHEFQKDLFLSYAFACQGIRAVAITGIEYPQQAIFSFLSQAVRVFCDKMAGKWEMVCEDVQLSCLEVADLFQKFQNPEDADKLLKIQGELEEVKTTVMNSMDLLLERGETLNSLIEKSKDLSDSSKNFRRMAEKNNSWCDWLKKFFR